MVEVAQTTNASKENIPVGFNKQPNFLGKKHCRPYNQRELSEI